MSDILDTHITQAKCTRAELSQASIDGQITPGRVYYVTDESLYVGGISTTQTVDLVTELQVIGYSLPGTGNVWDDANAHMFSGPYADGEGRLPIGTNTVLTVGHNGTLYRWFGPAPVCIGAGGAGGIYSHHIVVDGDFVPSGSTSHAALDDRALADAHPQAAIGGRGAEPTLEDDQIAQDARLSTLEGHPGRNDNPHTVTKAQVGLSEVDNTSDASKPISGPTQTVLTDHDNRLVAIEGHPGATNNPHSVTKAQVGLGNADNTSDLAKPISSATQTALNGKLGAVADDTSPVLGGRLSTEESEIAISKLGGDIVGLIGYGLDLDGDFAFFAHTQVDGIWEQSMGAISLNKSGLQLYGGSVKVGVLENAAGAGKGQQVYATDEGLLYGVDPPDPGWEESDTDVGIYDLGTGTGVGPWVELTGLVITVPQDVANGNRVDVFALLETYNVTGNRSGEIEVGFGINGVPPATGQPKSIGPGFSGYVSVNITTTNHGGLTAGDTISVFSRRSSGSHNTFGVIHDGSGSDDHELIVSIPGEGGGGAQLPQQVSPAEKTAGTETSLRSFSPLDVAEMALAHGPGAGGAVLSVFGRTGDVVAQFADYNADQIQETATGKIFTSNERDKLTNIEPNADVSPVASVHGRTGTVVGANGDYDAGQISETAGEKIFTSAERTKLAGIAAGATVAPVDSVHGRTGMVVGAVGDYDADQISETVGNKILTAAERTKLAGVEYNATADQTGTEIVSAVDTELGGTAWKQPTGATRTFFIPAASFQSSVNYPTTWGSRETGSFSTIEGWDMPAGADSLVQCWYPMPREQTGTIKFRTYWTQAGAGAGNVRWLGRAKAVGDGDSLNFLSSVSAVMLDAAQGADVLHSTIPSNAYSPSGAGTDKLMRFDVWRNGADADDTLAEAATFLGIFVQYAESESPPAAW